VPASLLEILATWTGVGNDSGPNHIPLCWTPSGAVSRATDQLDFESSSAETPAAQIDCEGDRVEIWAVRHTGRRLGAANRVLTRADWDEINGIRHAATRLRAIAARTALRTALSHAVDGQVPASAWRLARTPCGKPYVCPELPPVHFNVSHTDGLSVIAVSRDRPVGIDIEANQISLDDEFVRTFLSRREWDAVRRLPQGRRQHDTIRLWTLKEAYAKLLGTGISADFKSLEFQLDPARLMSSRESAKEGRGTRFLSWSVSGPTGSCQLTLAIGQPRPRRTH
jgi:4'-phosphopantetheinyl transferase